jgi:chemotaxis signal transduction protein
MNKQVTLSKPSELLSNELTFNASQLFALSRDKFVEKKDVFHGVKCGELYFLVNEGILGEVVDTPTICKIPQTSDTLLGMCSLRGNIIPIFNLHKILKIDPIPKMARVLVLGESTHRIGFAIEQLPVKVLINPEERVSRMPPLPDVILPFVRNCFFRDSLWIDWDIFSFFNKVSKQV